MLYEANTGSDPATSINYQVFNKLKGDDENVFKGLKRDPYAEPYPIAVKRISANEFPDYQKRIEREINGMNKNRTISNVIKFEGLIPVDDKSPFQFIAFEDYECSFTDLALEKIRININICDLLKDAVTGLYHIHNNKMTHRNIYADNILVCLWNGKYTAKISNLALSKEFKTGMTFQSVSSGLFKQNGYVAPELFAAKVLAPHGVDTAVDIFSMGVVFFYMLSGGEHLFFKHDTEMQRNIANKSFKPKVESIQSNCTVPKYKNFLLMQLILKMVAQNPNDRPKALDILHHPAFWTFDKIERFFVSISGYFDDNYCDKEKYSHRELNGWQYKIDKPIKDAILSKSNKTDVHGGIFNLFKVIRNLISHVREPEHSKDLREFLENNKHCEQMETEGLKWYISSYFLEKFPILLYHAYDKMQKHKNVETLREFYTDFNFNEVIALN